MSNACNNTLASITDRKIPQETGTPNGIADYYLADIATVQDYYPFGMVMPGRNWQAATASGYGFGFNGKLKDDEIMGNSNSYDFGARIYDARLGKWLSSDPVARNYPYESNYASFGNNPVIYIDIKGMFKLTWTQEALNQAGLNPTDIVRFQQIVDNLDKIIADNPQLMEAIINSTGYTKEQIEADFKKDAGSTIEIQTTAAAATSWSDVIYADPRFVKALTDINPSNVDELALQTLGTAITLIHEYGHMGDKITNGGNSGQYSIDPVNCKRIWEAPDDSGEDNVGNAIQHGAQNWHVSLSGLRGTDIEWVGFGVYIEFQGYTEGDINISSPFKITSLTKISAYPKCTPYKETVPAPPTALPEKLQGTQILETLNVE